MLAQLPGGFVQRQIARNLNPVRLVFSPDGRLFIVEKDGKVREEINDVLAPDPFLTLTNIDMTNERGLEGMCFHPDFPKTPYFYLYYTVKDESHNRVSRFEVKNGKPDLSTEKVLLNIDPLLGTIHNAGDMLFGPDRKLYVSVGDGSNPTMAQSLNSLLGKVLRLNDDGGIPADNPFVSQTTGVYQAIYATGFRNPFTLDINRTTGRLLVGDVGGENFEEIDDILPGHNYGWPLIEGPRNGQDAPANYSDPLYSYDHNVGCAITGLVTYNPPTVRFPAAYAGKIFFADYCEGFVHLVNPETGQYDDDFATDIDRPVALAVSPDGYLYYLARAGQGGGSQQDNTSTWNGSLYKVSFFDSGLPYISTQSAGAFVPVGEAVTFNVNAVGQKPLTYTWYRNGQVISGANQANYSLPSPVLADNGAIFSCIVRNVLGADTSATMSLKVVQGQRPVAHIIRPDTNVTYRAGDVLSFAGEALMPNKQPLSNATSTWWIEFHHEDHVHPALDPIVGFTSGSYTIPNVGETSTDVWYRVYLQVADVTGLTSRTYVDVKPQTALVTISSNQQSTKFLLDGEPLQPDLTFESVVGMRRKLETKAYVAEPDGFYKFMGWNNNPNSTTLTYEVPTANSTVSMTYQKMSVPNGNGLLGEYFTNTDSLTGKPALVRTDTTINFDWQDGSPALEISADHFVVRWTGTLQAPLTDLFTFYTQTDDGLRLWVNNKLLIDQWGITTSDEWAGQMPLEAGKNYSIRMEYQEDEGYADAHLFWASPLFDKAVISKPYLFSGNLITATEPTVDDRFTVFPIPASEQATVRYTAHTAVTAQLEVTDMLGRQVHVQPVSVRPGTNEYVLRVSSWSAGLYQVILRPTDQPPMLRRLLIH